MKHEPIKWPTSESRWWWMRFRMSPRSKWRVLLVEVQLGTKFAMPLHFDHGYARSLCEKWNAVFVPGVPAEPPPEEWQ